MRSTSRRDAIVFRAHYLDDFVIRQFHSLKSCEDKIQAKVFLSFDGDAGERVVAAKHFHRFTAEDARIKFANCNKEKPLWYNPDYIILDFWQKHPNFDYYWLIEYDVFWAGRWEEFFVRFLNNDCDFVTTALKTRSDIFGARYVQPQWVWWQHINYQPQFLVGCFFPVNRFSQKALKTLTEAYSKGLHGYSELLVPTVLYNAGCSLDDLYLYPDLCDEQTFNYEGPVNVRQGAIHHPLRSTPSTEHVAGRLLGEGENWIDQAVEKELSNWEEGISKEQLEHSFSCGEINLRLKIINGQLFVEETFPGFQSRHEAIISVIRATLQRYKIADVEFLMNTADNHWQQLFNCPVFIQSKADHCKCILYPDFSFGGWPEIGEPEWEEFKLRMNAVREKFPWNERRAQAYFRGAPTHPERLRFAELAENSDLLDVAVSNWAKDGDSKDVRTALFEPFENVCRYKYALNLPGRGWCVRYKYLYTTGCLVFKVAQPEREFWEGVMVPYEDFVPLDGGTSNEDVLKYLQLYKENDPVAEYIAENGRKKVQKTLTMDNVYAYLARLLNGYSRIQRWEVTAR